VSLVRVAGSRWARFTWTACPRRRSCIP